MRPHILLGEACVMKSFIISESLIHYICHLISNERAQIVIHSLLCINNIDTNNSTKYNAKLQTRKEKAKPKKV